jgi:predicted adenine nucleotide alpha hydrolase (AANH) superfamily ATPase
VHEISFFYSPKIVRADMYRERYEALKAFLAEQGINTAQPITAERNY